VNNSSQEGHDTMPQVNFYLLHTLSRQERDRLACQLVDKASQQGLRIFICTELPAHAKFLDDLLWTFRQDSFIPHVIYPDPEHSQVPVIIGNNPLPELGCEVLINLSETVPHNFHSFQRIIEIIDDTEPAKQAGRQRFRFYREHGIEPLPPHDIHR
jgi:DNA polymerase-3 subunit chi